MDKCFCPCCNSESCSPNEIPAELEEGSSQKSSTIEYSDKETQGMLAASSSSEKSQPSREYRARKRKVCIDMTSVYRCMEDPRLFRGSLMRMALVTSDLLKVIRPSKAKLKETPIKPKLKETPIRPRLRETPIQPKLRETPIQPKLREIPVEHKLRETPVEPKLRETPIRPKLRETPIQPKLRETPIRPKLRESPIKRNDIHFRPLHIDIPLQICVRDNEAVKIVKQQQTDFSPKKQKADVDIFKSCESIAEDYYKCAFAIRTKQASTQYPPAPAVATQTPPIKTDLPKPKHPEHPAVSLVERSAPKISSVPLVPPAPVAPCVPDVPAKPVVPVAHAEPVVPAVCAVRGVSAVPAPSPISPVTSASPVSPVSPVSELKPAKPAVSPPSPVSAVPKKPQPDELILPVSSKVRKPKLGDMLRAEKTLEEACKQADLTADVKEADAQPPKPVYHIIYPQHKEVDVCIKCRFDPSPLVDQNGLVFCPGNCGCCLCGWQPRATRSLEDVLRHSKIKVCKCRNRGTIFSNFSKIGSACSQISIADMCPCREKAEARFLERFNVEMWDKTVKLRNLNRGQQVSLKDVKEIRPGKPGSTRFFKSRMFNENKN